jgi:plastocyanin
MKRLSTTLLSVFSLAAFASGGTIAGKIVGWPPGSLAPQRTAVVWLDGAPVLIAGKADPVMVQSGGQFVPNFLVVVVGQTVDMPNDDQVAHNVYSLSGAKNFNLGYYAKGELKTVTFDRPGVVDVLCLIHSFMRARILVLSSSSYSSIATDGSFRIRNVPAGSFTLKFWGDGMDSFSQDVIVPADNKPVMVSFPLPKSSLTSQPNSWSKNDQRK